MQFFGTTANATNIRYLVNGQPMAADVLTDDAGNPRKVKMPVGIGAQGVYVRMFVGAMDTDVDAYIAFDIASTITATAGEHGTITPSGATTVTPGAIQVYTITPDTNYTIKDVLVDGQSEGAIDSYTFSNVTKNRTIEATFEKQPLDNGEYTVYAKMMMADDITKPSMAAGSLVREAKLDVIDGEWFLTIEFKTLTLGPATGDAANIKYYEGDTKSTLHDATVVSYRTDAQGNQQVEKVKMPVAVSAEGVYVNMEVNVNGSPAHGSSASDAYIAFSFENKYAITASAGANGTISPVGQTMVTAGADQVYTITPDSGYEISDVLVDNVSVGKKTSHKFEAVNADHMIKAVFAKKASQGGGGGPIGTVEDSFGVYTAMKNANDITKDSMAKGAISSSGEIEVIDGDWYLTVTFKPINFMGQQGYAEDIKYYSNGTGSSSYDAEVLSSGSDGEPRKVRMPVETDGDGVYINMYVAAMGTATDAYIAFSKSSFDSSDDNTSSNQPTVTQPDNATKATETAKKDEIDLANIVPSYQDVSPLHRYFGAVERLSRKGLIKGTGDGQFTPHAVVNRATLTTLLYRVAGKPAVDNATSFTDVPANQWYSTAIAWAKNNDVVNGYSAEQFGPNDVLTKEQIMTIVYRYQKKLNKAVGEAADLSKYSDNAKVSAYAKEAMAWSLANNLLTLDDFGRINPQEKVTRADMAVILDKVVTWQEANR